MTARYDTHGDVAVITLDHPPVNGMGHTTRSAIQAGLERAWGDATVRAIVLTGAGRVFSGGADIREFGTPAALAEPHLLMLIAAVEGSAKPVVAAINGVCFGGGLELSLACHYRVAAPVAQVALPEVKLGLVPGAGGTQRLPRAAGAEAALRMIVSGDPVGAADALAHGIVDAVLEGEFVAAAVAFARTAAASGALPKVRERNAALPPGLSAEAFFSAARTRVQADARGLAAPLACLECVQAAVTEPFDAGLLFERATFMRLMVSAESKALRHAFFAERTAARVADLPEGTATRPIRHVGVVGCGTMGGGIAMACANAGLPVRVYEQDAAALERGLAACRANWEATARKGRLTADDVARRMALLTPILDLAALADCDLVIEAVYEDLAVKQALFRRLDAIARPGAILATNTSTLDVDAIAAATRRPGDVIGLHFFSPAHVMRLLEVVRGAATAPDVLATAMAFGRQLKKVAVVSGVCDGFIGNRMLEQYVRQSLFLIDEGASPRQIDAALVQFGMAMGPFTMYDMAGMDIGYAIRQRRYVEKPHIRYSRIGDRVVELGRLGQKTGKGWYRYEPGNRRPQPDPEIDALIAAYRTEIGITPRTIGDDEIVQRCVYALVNEGARILAEGIAQRASDIDVVYLAGYGFPVRTGGPMHYAQAQGLDGVLAAMRGFAANPHADPAFWTPAPLLVEAAATGRLR